MTTQELKEYINKVLGNTIRCLLPSYWWKRLFGIVVDKIDEVELNAGKTIETSLKDFEKKYPSVASRTFYFTEDPDSDHAKSNVKLSNSLYMQLIGGVSSKKQVDISPVYLAMPLYSYFDNFYWIQSPQFFSLIDTTFYNVRLQDGKSYDIGINQSTGVCTQTPASGGGGSNITVDSSLSTSSTNPVQNKVVATALNNKQQALVSGTNIKTINGTSILGSGNINVAASVDIDTTMSDSSTNPVQNKVVKSYIDENIGDEVYVGSTPPTDENVTVWIDLDASAGDVEWDGIVVDEELSPTSTNPIQNKTVYALSERLAGIEAILDNING